MSMKSDREVEKIISTLPGFPLFEWDLKTTKVFIAENELKPGDAMIIYNGQANMHHYTRALIVNPSSGRQKRVVPSKAAHFGGTSFLRSGKTAFRQLGNRE